MSNRVALTIARRTSVRSLARSILIAVLIAIPIAGLSATTVVAASMQATPVEKVATQLGRSQALIRVVTTPDQKIEQNPSNLFAVDITPHGEGGSTPVTPSAVLPAGTRVIPVFAASATVTTASGLASLPTLEGKTWDPSLAGHFDLVSGHRPTSPDQILVSHAALARLGVAVGGTVELRTASNGGHSLRIVGVLDNRTNPSSTATLFGFAGTFSTGTSTSRISITDYYLPDHPLDWAAVQKLNAHGMAALSREVVLGPSPAGTHPADYDAASKQNLLLLGAVLGAFAAFEIVLLAGAAFAVNARQQQRTLAIVASVGGTRSTLFRILSATGLVLGAVGGVVGTIAGVGIAALFMTVTTDGSATRYYGFHVDVAQLGAVVAFSILLGWVSALVPAVSGSKLDVVSALRGARRPPPSGRRRPIIGSVILLLGFAVTLTGGIGLVLVTNYSVANDGGTPAPTALVSMLTALVMIGPLAAQVGLILCGPLLFRTLARIGSRGGLGARLATRDSARNSARTVPAFAAVLTTVFVSVFLMCTLASAQAGSAANYRYATLPGQVKSWVAHNDPATNGIARATDITALADGLRQSFDVKAVRVLSSVPEYISGGSGSAGLAPSPATQYASPSIPTENFCPNDQRSPEYTPALDNPTGPAARALRADPRCTSYSNLDTASSYSGHIWVGGPADIALVTGHPLSSAGQKTLAGGGIVSLHPEYVREGKAGLDWWTAKQTDDGAAYTLTEAPERSVSLPAVVEKTPHPLDFGMFISPETAARLGLTPEKSVVLASLRTPATDAQMDAARQFTSTITGDPTGNSVAVENGPSDDALFAAWGLLALAALVTIASSAVAIGLARFDGRADTATLASVGAGQRLRRSVAFWQALGITGTGAVLGSVLGLLPAVALGLPGGSSPFAAPWLQIVGVAIALPVAIAIGGWLLPGRSERIARRIAIS